MAYQVLARKWRPQDFSSLVGQEPIVTALRNALTEGRIAQAYLFSGIRGVGKTTSARLLAKALNCENGPASDPCNECLPCREITRGADLDVIEVDAATYSKVEQVRELTESLRYGPARDRYKVVVIDEIHRLSRQAFDALLKIVEEPPPHLVFIFATTEIEAVPATVLSRCQEFRFRRVPVREMTDHLREIADAEEIDVSDTALRLISRAGEGSVRDSVALLDQLATFGAGTIHDEDAARLSGSLDTSLFQELLGAILGGRGSDVSKLARSIEAEGWDPRHVYTQFLTYCRDGLHLALGGDPGQLDLPGEEAEALRELAGRAGYENLLRLLQQLLAGEEMVRRSEAGGLALEIAWLRAAELPKLVRIEELLAGGPVTPRFPAPQASPAPKAEAPRPSAGPAEPPREPEPPRREPPAEAPSRKKAEREAAPEASSPSAAPAPRIPAGGGAATRPAGPPSIETFREEVSIKRPPLAGRLAAATEIVFEDGELLIYLPLKTGGEIRALERKANRATLDEVVKSLWGPEATWRAEPAPEEPSGDRADGDDEPAGDGELGDAASHPKVQAVLDIFGGTVDSVEPRDEGQEG